MSLFEKDIDQMSEEELKTSVEQLRLERRAGSPRPNTKKASAKAAKKSPSDKALDKICAMPEDVLAGLLAEVQKSKEEKKSE